jgi:hypothetical protein
MPWASIVTRRWGERPRGTARRADPTPRPAREPDPRRVLEDVLDDGAEICVVFDHTGFEPILEKVTAAGVAPVEPHRMDAVEPLHTAREVGLGRLDEQVEVVVEQVPRVHAPSEAPSDVDEALEPGFAVAIVEHDRPLLDAAADDVVPGRARKLAPRDPRHSVRRYRAVCSRETVVKGQLPGTVPGTRPSQTSVVQTGA